MEIQKVGYTFISPEMINVWVRYHENHAKTSFCKMFNLFDLQKCFFGKLNIDRSQMICFLLLHCIRRPKTKYEMGERGNKYKNKQKSH